MKGKLRIGTRASKLALAQAQKVADALGVPYEIMAMTTAGDKELHKTLDHWGYKGLFTKELEDALLGGQIDIAVHSMKDMPSELPPGLVIAALLERADVRDAWVSSSYPSFMALPPGAVVGTSSARRAAQILYHHPQTVIVPLRGNVETRLRKLKENVAEATLLACAGLDRLGLQDVIVERIGTQHLLPAVAQGAIGVECRESDAEILSLLGKINHAPTYTCLEAERALLRVLDGSCKTSIGGLAVLEGEQLHIQGEVLSPDGAMRHHYELRGPASDALPLGEMAGEALRAMAGDQLLRLA